MGVELERLDLTMEDALYHAPMECTNACFRPLRCNTNPRNLSPSPRWKGKVVLGGTSASLTN